MDPTHAREARELTLLLRPPIRDFVVVDFNQLYSMRISVMESLRCRLDGACGWFVQQILDGTYMGLSDRGDVLSLTPWLPCVRGGGVCGLACDTGDMHVRVVICMCS